MITAILLAALAHVNFAVNDLSGAIGARKLGAYKMSIMAWSLGCVPFAFLGLFLFRHDLYLRPLIVNILSAALIAFSYPLFLITVEKGNPTINGVIAGIFPLWVVILSLLFYGETLTYPQLGALLIIFPGVILSPLHLNRTTRLRNLFNKYSLLALFVSLMWGLSFTIIRQPVDAYGWFEAGFVQQFTGAFISIIWLMPKIGGSFKNLFARSNLKWPIVNAITGATGGLSYNAAITLGASSVVTPIAGSYPGLYAIGSYLIFKEKLTKLQIAGVVLTLTGVVILSIASI